MEHHLLQQRDHGAGRMRTHDVFRVRKIFVQDVPLVVGYFAYISWLNAYAVIGKNAECGSLLE